MKEQLYNDFVTKFLPTVQEGLVITKDYFTDLFSRYIKYLIVLDTASAILCIVLFLISIWLTFSFIPRWYKKGSPEPYKNDRGLAWVPAICLLVISFIAMIDYSGKLIKDLYIPEIRVWETLQPLTK